MPKKKANAVNIRKAKKPSLLVSLIDTRYLPLKSKHDPIINRKVKKIIKATLF